MEEVIKLDAVDKYNKLFGLETRHPLVNVIDLSKATRYPTRFRIDYGVYALYLKNSRCGDILYGRQNYDYQAGTIVCFAPGQCRTNRFRHQTDGLSLFVPIFSDALCCVACFLPLPIVWKKFLFLPVILKIW